MGEHRFRYAERPQTGCTNPSGTAGNVIYAHGRGVVQFCNGSSWVDTACAADRSPNGSGCGGKPAGTIQYAGNPTHELQFCDSTNWVAMGWPCAGGGGAPVIPVEPGVVYISSNINNLNISSLFSNGEWADSGLPKKIVVNAGVTVGLASATLPALRTGSGRANNLIIVNHGIIAGMGGAANGGVGGTALLVEQIGVTVLNSGTLAGGGGKGGTGGIGYGMGTLREPTTGEKYTLYSVEWTLVSPNASNNASSITIKDNSSAGYSNPSFTAGNGAITSVTKDGITYKRGSLKTSGYEAPWYFWRYAFYTEREDYVLTDDGVGGDGGRGQGSDGAATAGLAGAAGGELAGAGGAYGLAGSAGGAGATSEIEAGTAGSAGGAAGAAISGSGYTLTTTCTVLGSH